MRKIAQNFLIITTLYFLAGCGFATFNAKSLPPQLKEIYYQAENPYAPFETAFKKKLKSCGIKFLPNPTKSTLNLNLSSNYSYTSNNQLSSTQARIYTLNYTATISITDYNQKLLLAPKSASATRNIILQPNEVFAVTPQITNTKQELSRELANKIFNILGSHRTHQDLQNHEASN